MFIKYDKEGQLRLVNSALTFLTEAPPPTSGFKQRRCFVDGASACLFSFQLFSLLPFFPETSQVAAAKRERQMAASNRPLGSTADGGSTRWAAGEAAWDAARTLFRVDGGWGGGHASGHALICI